MNNDNTTTENKIFELFFHCTLFFLLFEMASGYSFHLMEISFVGLVLSFGYVFYLKFRFSLVKFSKLLVKRLNKGIFVVMTLFVYIIFDVFNSLYSPDIMLVILKYKVVMVMGVMSICLLYYCKSYKEIDRVLKNIAYMGFFTSVFTVINYVFLRIYPIYYTLRLTLRRDYNMFAVTIFIALIAWFIVIINGHKSTINKLMLSLIAVMMMVPVIMLSGSRRIYILILPTLLVLYTLILAKQSIVTRNFYKTLFLVVLWTVSISFMTYANTLALNLHMLSVYQVEGSEGSGSFIKGEETSATDRYETIGNTGLFDKRRIIWRIAIEDLEAYNSRDIFLGRGNAYDITLYDTVYSEELNNAYPDREGRQGKLSAHNFMLADMLNGGLVKTSISLTLTIALIYLMIKFILSKPFLGIPYSMIIGLIFINNLISNRYGLLYDKFFYIFFGLIVLEISMAKGKGEFGEGNEKSFYDNYSA